MYRIYLLNEDGIHVQTTYRKFKDYELPVFRGTVDTLNTQLDQVRSQDRSFYIISKEVS